jgi:hypothetical protein
MLSLVQESIEKLREDKDHIIQLRQVEIEHLKYQNEELQKVDRCICPHITILQQEDSSQEELGQVFGVYCPAA